jgi:hypothetical protein
MAIPKAVSQLIEASGTTFHAKVARWFGSNGWHVVISPYYMDHAQSKARELDLVVEKLWPISDEWGRGGGSVVVRLFVECKYVTSETVFWFAPKNKTAALSLVCSLGPFRKNNSFTDKHHYLATSPRVAKIFSSNNAKAAENEPFYKALNQSLNATIAMRSQAPTHPDLAARRGGKIVVLQYPVVVCSSFASLYDVDFLAESEAVEVEENFQLEVQYAYLDANGKQRDDYFLLDFVEFEKLPAFGKAIGEGAKAASLLVSS